MKKIQKKFRYFCHKGKSFFGVTVAGRFRKNIKEFERNFIKKTLRKHKDFKVFFSKGSDFFCFEKNIKEFERSFIKKTLRKYRKF